MLEKGPMLLILFLSIVIHEYAHGYIAFRLGDPTAMKKGRLTLNPLAHIDPIGTIVLPLILVLTNSPFLFGWAKPVPVNPRHFSNPITGMAKVGVAGPGANLLLALGAAIMIRIAVAPNDLGGGLLESLLFYTIQINVILAILNLLPVPPLDGSRIIIPFLPQEGRRLYWRLERFGMFIVMGLLVTGLLWRIITPVIRVFLSFFFSMAGLI